MWFSANLEKSKRPPLSERSSHRDKSKGTTHTSGSPPIQSEKTVEDRMREERNSRILCRLFVAFLVRCETKSHMLK